MQRERAPLSVEAACAPNSHARVLAGVAGRHLRGRGVRRLTGDASCSTRMGRTHGKELVNKT
jgi:hypothetical protein